MADAPENVATLGAPLTLQRMAQLREELEAVSASNDTFPICRLPSISNRFQPSTP